MRGHRGGSAWPELGAQGTEGKTASSPLLGQHQPFPIPVLGLQGIFMAIVVLTAAVAARGLLCLPLRRTQ